MNSVRKSWNILHPAIGVTLEALESRLMLSVYGPQVASPLNPSVTYQATQVAFLGTPGSAGAAGRAIGPAITVAIEDAGGDIVRSDDSVVMLHAVAGTFSNHQSSIAAAAVDGIATFNNVILKKNGDHALQATDGGLTAATAGGFWVGPLTIDSKSALPLSTITLSGPALNSSQQYEIDFTARGSTVQSPLTSISPIQVLAPIPLNAKKSAIASSVFHLSLEEPGGGVMPIGGSLSVKPFPKESASLGSATVDFLQSMQTALDSAADNAKAVASTADGAALAESQFGQLAGMVAGEIQSIQSLAAGGPEPRVLANDAGSQILLSKASLQLTDEMFAQLSQSLTPSAAASAIAPDDLAAWAQSAGALMGSVRQANGAVAQGLGFVDSYGLAFGQPAPAAAENAFAAGEFFAFNVIPLAYSTLVDAGAAFINPPAGQGVSALRQYGFADQVNYFGALSASFLYNSFSGTAVTDLAAGDADAATAAATAFTDIDVKGGIGRELLVAADTGIATSVDYLAGPATSDGLLSEFNPLLAPGVLPTPTPVAPSPPVTPTPPPTNPVMPSPPPHTPSPPPHTPSPPPVTPTPPPYTPSPPPVTPTPPPYTPSPPPVTPTPPPYTPSPPPATPTPPPYTPSPPPATPTPPPYTPSPPPATPTPPPYTPTPPPYTPTPPPYTPTPPPYTPTPPPYTPTPPPYTPSPPPYTPSPPPTTDLARPTTKAAPSSTTPQNTAGPANDNLATQSTHPDTSATAAPDTESAERFVTPDAPSALDHTTYNIDSAAASDGDSNGKMEKSGTLKSLDDVKPTDKSATAEVSKSSNIAADASGQSDSPSHSATDNRATQRHAAARPFDPKWARNDPAAADDRTGVAHPLVSSTVVQDQSTTLAEERILGQPLDAAAKTASDKTGLAKPAITLLSARPVATLEAHAAKPAIESRVTPISHASVDADAARGLRHREEIDQHSSSRRHREKEDMINAEDSLASIAKPAPPVQGPIARGIDGT